MASTVLVKNLSVTLGGVVKALKNINFEVEEGKITGVIGPSGAGKTTLMKCLVGRMLIPEKSITLLNYPAGSKELRDEISYMSQESSIYFDLSIKENLIYFSKINGIKRTEIKSSVNQILSTVNLTDKSNSLVRNLSGGQKQRVSLAIALIGSPKLMVLDEPTVGLDPVLRNQLWDLFNSLASSGKTIIITSHSMDEAKRCQDLILLRNGRIISQSAPKELLDKTGTSSVEKAFLKLVGEKNEPN